MDRVLRRRQAEEGLGHRRRRASICATRRAAAAARGPTTTRSSSRRRAGTNAKLMRVSAAGGTPAAFGDPRQGATTQRWPQALPGGKGVLYTEHSATRPTWTRPTSSIAPLVGRGAEGRRPRRLLRPYVRAGRLAERVEREGGHLIYMQQGTLFAVRLRSRSPRDDRPGRAGARGRRRDSGPRRRAAGLLVRRHARLRARRGRDDRAPDRLADARRQDVGAACDESRLGKSAVLAGRPEAGARHLRRQAARHLGVRVGAGHPDPTDLRPR